MNKELVFSDRAKFRAWLEKNAASSEGVWLVFGKKGGPVTLTGAQALEEALCFGWIDGKMQSIDDTKYKKYFAHRTVSSRWSDKNKKLVAELEKRGIMTDDGRAEIKRAKKNGQWDAPKAPVITDEQIAALFDLLKEYEPAYTNFQGMALSVKKTYTRAYFDAKTQAGRTGRLAWMVDRLSKNLKPM